MTEKLAVEVDFLKNMDTAAAVHTHARFLVQSSLSPQSQQG